jgi:hypothetical protein
VMGAPVSADLMAVFYVPHCPLLGNPTVTCKCDFCKSGERLHHDSNLFTSCMVGSSHNLWAAGAPAYELTLSTS